MELYYHVFHIKKAKECRFTFQYMGERNKYVQGHVNVIFGKLCNIANFDGKSGGLLNTREKNHIVDIVLKHICKKG